MQAIFWTMEEVAARAKQFYENGIRQDVEHGDNIGQMIVIIIISLKSLKRTNVLWNLKADFSKFFWLHYSFFASIAADLTQLITVLCETPV